MTRILMVCLGNICRSPLAHGILESKLPSDLFYVDSCGTGNYHIGSQPDERSINVAKEHGIDISKQICRQFVVSDFDDFDHIYVMDVSNLRNVKKFARNQEDISKIRLILDSDDQVLKEVPDPYFGTEKDFEKVFRLLETACTQIARKIHTAK